MKTIKGKFLLKMGKQIWKRITDLFRPANANRLTIKNKPCHTGKLQETRYVTYCSQLLIA